MPAQRFQYDPSKPVEGQLQSFLAGRNPFGTMGNSDWQNVNNSKYYSSSMSAPDESGTTTQQYQSLDPRVQYHPGADSPYIIDGQYGAVAWKPTTDPNGIRVPGQATPDTTWGGAQPAQDSFVKPDNMYDYNNLYYDDTYGLLRDPRDYRDPDAKYNQYLDTSIMSVVGGIGGWAAAAANAAAGGAAVAGMQAPTLARTGLNAIQAAQAAHNGINTDAARPNAAARTNYGGGNVALNTLGNQNTAGIPTAGMGTSGNGMGTSGGDTSSGVPGDDSFMQWALGQLGGLTGLGGLANSGLGNAVQGGLSQYLSNQNNNGYRDDINNMINVGTGGVQTSDRAGARDLVRGVYDGSISGDQIFNKVPGLQALSDRGAADIGRQMSAHGDADPQSSARMREFVKFNNDLTSKAYASEMDRAMKVGGYDINPSAMAGQGLRALGDIHSAQTQQNAGLLALANRGTNGSSGNSNDSSLLQNIFKGQAVPAGAQQALNMARQLGLNPNDPRVLRLLNPNFSGTYTGGEDTGDPFATNTEDYGNNPYSGDPNSYLGNYGDTFNMDTFDPANFGLDIYG